MRVLRPGVGLFGSLAFVLRFSVIVWQKVTAGGCIAGWSLAVLQGLGVPSSSIIRS